MIRLLSMILFALVFTQLLWAAPKNKAVCSARELRGQDCRVINGSYQIRMLSETVARDGGTWHTVDPMPLKGAGIQWEKIRFDILHDWPILQFWLWDAGAGESPVQSLHWYVADARQGALKILAEGVVRRRRLRPPPDDAQKKPVYIHDGWEKHDLKVLKDGSLEWTLGSAKKNLGKARDHHGI